MYILVSSLFGLLVRRRDTYDRGRPHRRRRPRPLDALESRDIMPRLSAFMVTTNGGMSEKKSIADRMIRIGDLIRLGGLSGKLLDSIRRPAELSHVSRHSSLKIVCARAALISCHERMRGLFKRASLITPSSSSSPPAPARPSILHDSGNLVTLTSNDYDDCNLLLRPESEAPRAATIAAQAGRQASEHPVPAAHVMSWRAPASSVTPPPPPPTQEERQLGRRFGNCFSAIFAISANRLHPLPESAARSVARSVGSWHGAPLGRGGDGDGRPVSRVCHSLV